MTIEDFLQAVTFWIIVVRGAKPIPCLRGDAPGVAGSQMIVYLTKFLCIAKWERGHEDPGYVYLRTFFQVMYNAGVEVCFVVTQLLRPDENVHSIFRVDTVDNLRNLLAVGGYGNIVEYIGFQKGVQCPADKRFTA